MNRTTLERLAARAIHLDETAWGTDAAIEAANAYAVACEEAGYRFDEDEDAQRFAYCGAKATTAELVRFTLPRAIAALDGGKA